MYSSLLEREREREREGGREKIIYLLNNIVAGCEKRRTTITLGHP